MAYIVSEVFLEKLADGHEFSFFSSTESTNRILLYKGTIPTDADNWTIAGSASDLLATWTGMELNFPATSPILVMGILPSPTTVVASGTGTATWAALYSTSYGESRVLLTDVSEDGGGGGLIVDDVNVISGNNVTYINFSMTFAEV